MDSPVNTPSSEPSASVSMSDEPGDESCEPRPSSSALVPLETRPPRATPVGVHVVDYDLDDLTRGAWSNFVVRLRYALGSRMVHCTAYDDDAAATWGDVEFFPAFFLVNAGGRSYAYRGERTLAAMVTVFRDAM